VQEAALLNREPPLDAQMIVCINAWQTLFSCRPHGLRPMAIPKAAPILVPYRGEIPWTAIREYAALHGLGREAVGLLVDVISELDSDRTAAELCEMKQRTPR
jgi:hypothetical protein